MTTATGPAVPHRVNAARICRPTTIGSSTGTTRSVCASSAGPDADGRKELVDEGVGDSGLALVATASDHHHVAVTPEELADQCGLPDSLRTPYQGEAGAVGARPCEQRVQDAELVLPPDEVLVPHHCRQGGAMS